MNKNKLTAVLKALIGRTNSILKELGREANHRTFIPQDVAGLYSAIMEEDKLLKRFKLELEQRKVLTDEQCSAVLGIIEEHALSPEELLSTVDTMSVINDMNANDLVAYAHRLGIDPPIFKTQHALRCEIRKVVRQKVNGDE